jgi:hypothetical protein
MWKGPKSCLGNTGRKTAVRRRNFVKVRISSGGTRFESPSRTPFSSSKNMLITTSVVAIQKNPR